ncbi:hypothetical protein M758_UG313300 [Ceratodon purpureus]|nr:hypothetical protein M758_UG313300 [Ceratodon purpureus]
MFKFKRFTSGNCTFVIDSQMKRIRGSTYHNANTIKPTVAASTRIANGNFYTLTQILKFNPDIDYKKTTYSPANLIFCLNLFILCTSKTKSYQLHRMCYKIPLSSKYYCKEVVTWRREQVQH